MQLSSAFSFFFFFHKRIWYSKNFRSVANFYMTQCLLLQHSDISLPITKLIRDPRTTCWASCRYGARVDSIRLESLDLERNSFPSLTTDFFPPLTKEFQHVSGQPLPRHGALFSYPVQTVDLDKKNSNGSLERCNLNLERCSLNKFSP